MKEKELRRKIENLTVNIAKTVDKIINYGISNIFISGLTFTQRISKVSLEKVNDILLGICKSRNLVYINNENILQKDLFTDGLHLINSGKNKLSENIVDNINNFLC